MGEKLDTGNTGNKAFSSHLKRNFFNNLDKSIATNLFLPYWMGKTKVSSDGLRVIKN